jgi:hypothetical protein
MGIIFNIWWLYVSLICIAILETFEIAKRDAVSKLERNIWFNIFIWDYG